MTGEYATIASYWATNHEIHVVAPTIELHELCRSIPGAREQGRRKMWAIPATPATVARLSRVYGERLRVDRPLGEYVRRVATGYEESRTALCGPLPPPIPSTRLQPRGRWLHQRRAFWFAYPLEASMLAVTMGGGKTKIALDLVQNWRAHEVLIIAPKTAIEDAWADQLKEHMIKGFDAALCVNGSVRQRMELADSVMGGGYEYKFVIINHEAFWREPFATWALSRMWDLVIADESHREKSAGSKSSKFLGRLGTHARRRLALTGTPMPHSPLDVYGQYRFLDRGLFGMNYSKFEQQYAEYGGWQNREVIGFKNLDGLRRKFRTIAISIDDSKQGLPLTSDITRSVVLESSVRRVYDELNREFIADVGRGEITAANAGVKLLRLHQIACGHATIERDGKKETVNLGRAKLDGLEDVLYDFPVDEPIVIFVRFRADIAAVYDLCGRLRRSVSELSGSRNDLSKWKARNTDVLVAQIQAAKEGIDLTRSSVAIFYSTGISLGDYLQCRKRLHRPPQKRMVRFIHLLARGTRDVSTMRALKNRQDVIRATLRDERSQVYPSAL